MRRINRLGSVGIALLAAAVFAQPTVADEGGGGGGGGKGGTPAHINSVTITGDAVVGSTLQAVADVTGDPVPVVSYQWGSCGQPEPDKGSACSDLTDTSATYTVASGDVGKRIVVRATAKNSAGSDSQMSAPTAAVADPPRPSPPPAPPKPPPPAPPPVLTPTPVALAPVAPAPAAPAAPVSPFINPFPVVRIQGASVAGGAIIRVLRVTAPPRARVSIACSGTGCPLRHLAQRGAGRIRPLERYLPAGLAITIRVTRSGYIGKYVRFVVRSRAAPARRDACLLPGSNRPRRCPA